MKDNGKRKEFFKGNKRIFNLHTCIFCDTDIYAFIYLYTQHTQLFFTMSASANTFVGLKTVQMLYYHLRENKKNKQVSDLSAEK